MKKHRSKGDRCYNCGDLDYHAEECKLPPQPKKCHFCQSINHMVVSCPLKDQQALNSQESQPTFGRKKKKSIALPRSQRPRIGLQWMGAILLCSGDFEEQASMTEWRKWEQGREGAAGTAMYVWLESTTLSSLLFWQGKWRKGEGK